MSHLRQIKQKKRHIATKTYQDFYPTVSANRGKDKIVDDMDVITIELNQVISPSKNLFEPNRVRTFAFEGYHEAGLSGYTK